MSAVFAQGWPRLNVNGFIFSNLGIGQWKIKLMDVDCVVVMSVGAGINVMTLETRNDTRHNDPWVCQMTRLELEQ